MLYKINVELVVEADEAEAVVAVAFEHRKMCKKSALAHTIAAGESVAVALKTARESVAVALRAVV